MITLKHLKVEQFRLLSEVELDFPQRGSILIAGPGEAGKSTLLECIYFALYGTVLEARAGQPSRKQHRASLDDLVRYAEKRAVVTLTVSIGATELTITREIEREKGQRVVAQVRKLGMPAEQPITDLEKANQRIIAELGSIDARTLRNSCFIEQRGVDCLEQLSGREREATLHRLLGLEKLARLAEQFSLSFEDERRLAETTLHLRLAEVQARIPELSSKLGELEAALDAVSINEDLEHIAHQETAIEEQHRELEGIASRRAELKHSQGRLSQLRKAGLIIDAIIASYDTIAEAQRELPELEYQIIELERREREELPDLERRVRELADLTRSFGTLERMATDLLSAVNTIKELEQSVKQQQYLQETLADLDAQIVHARQVVEDARQSQHELEEQQRHTRPQLETRLQRLQAMAEKLNALDSYRQTRADHEAGRPLANENTERLAKLREELRASEQELELVEKEAQQAQEIAEAQEKHWRQLSIRRQLQEWHRLKGLSRGLTHAQQHVEAANQQREQLNSALLAARRSATLQIGIFVACLVLAVLCGGGALVEVLRQSYIFATIAGVVALALGAFGGVNLQSYGKSREEERLLDQQLQDANNRVSMMVAAREAALRLGGTLEELAPVEHEIRSLGGTVPRSLDEAQQLLQQLPAQEESIADAQQSLTEKRSAADAARSQVNVTMEAVATLRKEKARLQEQRQQNDWDNLDARLREDDEAIESLQNEIRTAAGEEGLPIPDFSHVSSSSTEESEAELRRKLDETIKATQLQTSAIASSMDNLPDMAAKLKLHQDALEALLARRQSLDERNQQVESLDPMRQIERAREQQLALRDALRALQDSLRERVLPLGVSFGQTAINAAEIAARKQLNALQVALGQKQSLQERYTTRSTLLRESQEALSEHYRKLAKFSNSLGNWIVPLNPFADALHALRARCDRELQLGDEQGLVSEQERLNTQESECQTRIASCRRSIEEAQGRIAGVLAAHRRTLARAYTSAEIIAVWPLVGEHTTQDRARLEKEIAGSGAELRKLEQLDLTLSEKLGTGKTALDLDEARRRMEQQERIYAAKERAGLLIAATFDRLMRKMLPRTEYYMQRLLPILTNGRYHDVRLSTESKEGISSGGPIQIGLWESAAKEYIPLSSLSGGIADQVSLALRLAFAIAALPRELNAAPGFLLLDEPLHLANHDHAQNLVDLICGDLLSQHFEQIIFTSHDPSLDAACFSYRITLDNGQIIESNLPAAAEVEMIAVEPDADEAVASSVGAGVG